MRGGEGAGEQGPYEEVVEAVYLWGEETLEVREVMVREAEAWMMPMSEVRVTMTRRVR